MPKLNSTAASLLVATLAAGAVAYGVDHYRTQRDAERKTIANVAGVDAGATAPQLVWTASASGRVEPRGGEVRIGSQIPGKVVQVLVRMNDTVKAGDLLVRLNDDDARAKLTGAYTEAAVRKRERNEEADQPVTAAQRRRNADADTIATLAADRRKAQDAIFDAERRVFQARMALDDLSIKSRSSSEAGSATFDSTRSDLTGALASLQRERGNLVKLDSDSKMPLPTRLEASLATARAEVALIETALERSRIRAPSEGTVLRVNTHTGETVTPSPEDTLLLFGDLSKLQVRAEVEERDVARVRSGQGVVVRSDAFPDQDFNGRVERMARSLGAPQLAGKGPRKPAEQGVMQVLIALEGMPSLMPGMRVDVFFKPDKTVDRASKSDVRAN